MALENTAGFPIASHPQPPKWFGRQVDRDFLNVCLWVSTQHTTTDDVASYS